MIWIELNLEWLVIQHEMNIIPAWLKANAARAELDGDIGAGTQSPMWGELMVTKGPPPRPAKEFPAGSEANAIAPNNAVKLSRAFNNLNILSKAYNAN